MNGMKYCRGCSKAIPDEGKDRCDDCQKNYDWRHRQIAPEVDTISACASVEPDGVKVITYHPTTGEKQIAIVSFEDFGSLCAFADEHQDLMYELSSKQNTCPECGLCQAEVVERYNYTWEHMRGDTTINLARRWKCWKGHEYYTDQYNRYQVSEQEHKSYQSELENLKF